MTKKKMTKQRVYAGLILVMAFLLLLGSNQLNRSNLTTLEDTVNSVFKDRILVQKYIFQLNNIFHEKELLLAKTEWKRNDVETTDAINKLLTDYGNTKLTTEESDHFNNLKENYAELQTFEITLMEVENSIDIESKKKIGVVLQKINRNLNKLSEVQFSEGRRLTHMSRKSLSMNLLLSRLEVALLIVIGFLFLFIVFYKENPKREPTEGNT
ncbi:hypothetical protein [Arenibacter sp. F20364]|uniref:MCP four helix bundle domain-containing protein n=1 Tax=Arenibacter sp. F20364 TaxID=2926415 RepID=UPI001FF3221D|nr:hypothetical protein [Arenibacter sp. F20364]MCK0192036.1 hypothetical protein [Arenibacter sp. F20364]